jgi:translation elongation factor EF-Ts
MKVRNILNQVAGKDEIKVKRFVRFKVGEGI